MAVGEGGDLQHGAVVEVLQTDARVLALLSYCLMHDLRYVFTKPADRAVATRVFRQLLHALDVAYRSVSGRGPGGQGSD